MRRLSDDDLARLSVVSIRSHSLRQLRRNGRRPGRKTVVDLQPRWNLICLEDRTLLSSVNWINAAGGDWDTPANWNTDSVPSASDDVWIDLSPGITIAHSQNDADSVNTLTLASPDTLSISNGSLSIESASDDRRHVQPDGRDAERGPPTVTGASQLDRRHRVAGAGRPLQRAPSALTTLGTVSILKRHTRQTLVHERRHDDVGCPLSPFTTAPASPRDDGDVRRRARPLAGERRRLTAPVRQRRHLQRPGRSGRWHGGRRRRGLHQHKHRHSQLHERHLEPERYDADE